MAGLPALEHSFWVRPIAIFLLAGLLAGCQGAGDPSDENRALARVYNKKLYLSHMDGMFPDDATAEDSSLIINAYVNRWIREAIILHEAEQNIPVDLNLDKMVRDYRASLILHNYEQKIVEQELDSTVTQQELRAFYQKNKEQYQLETPIIRCYFIKVPTPVPQVSDVRRWWNDPSGDNYRALLEYCNQYAESHILEDSTWHRVEDIALDLPKGTLTIDNVFSKRDFTQRDGDYQYYLKVFEIRNQKEIAPLSYIEGQARKYILHNRKIKLLEEKRETLYERELRSNNISIYTQ